MCKRPGPFAFGDADPLKLPGGATSSGVAPEAFLIAQLNRFKGANVPAGQALGATKFTMGEGISSSVAYDALTVVIRRLQGSLEVINDDNARKLLSDARQLLAVGDATGTGGVIQYVKANVVPIGNQVAAFADSLGLPPAANPGILGSIFSKVGKTTLLVGGGLVAAAIFLRRR